LSPETGSDCRRSDERLRPLGDRGTIFAEKVSPYGLRLSRVFALAFVAFGIWIAAAPPSVPRLTDPSEAPNMMQMGNIGERMEPASGKMQNDPQKMDDAGP
jgi:hypothetical protein